MAHQDPEIRINRLFGDHGRRRLEASGLGASWGELLGGVPSEVASLPQSSAFQWIVALRRYWVGEGDYTKALLISESMSDLLENKLGTEHLDVLVERGTIGWLLLKVGEMKKGGQMIEAAFNTLKSQADSNDLRIALVAEKFADYRFEERAISQGEKLLWSAYGIRKGVSPDSVGPLAGKLGGVLVSSERFAEAIPLLEECWELSVSKWGDTHPLSLTRGRFLARVLFQAGNAETGGALMRELHRGLMAQGDKERAAHIGFELGVLLEQAGDSEQALRHLESAIRWTRGAAQADGLPHPTLPERCGMLAELLWARGRTREVEGILQEALEATVRLFGEDVPEVARRYIALARYYGHTGEHNEAVGLLERAVSINRTQLGLEDDGTQKATVLLVEMLLDAAERIRAGGERGLDQVYIDRATQLTSEVLGPGHSLGPRVRRFARSR